MLLDSTVELRREKDNLLLVRKKSPERPSRSLAPPTLSKSFDSHKYENFGSRPPKTSPSSRITTQSRAHAPKSVDSSDDDEEDHDSSGPAKGEIGDDADLIAETLSRYTTFKIDEEVTAGAKLSPDPSIHLAGSTNHAEDHAAQTTGKKENEKGNSSTERPDNERSRSTAHIVRRADRSPSDSESERGPLRRADTQLYEADSEGSGGEGGTFERRHTWRRPTVEEEDEVIETHVTRRPTEEYEIIVEEE